jgi:hypothetical protein
MAGVGDDDEDQRLVERPDLLAAPNDVDGGLPGVDRHFLDAEVAAPLGLAAAPAKPTRGHPRPHVPEADRHRPGAHRGKVRTGEPPAHAKRVLARVRHGHGVDASVLEREPVGDGGGGGNDGCRMAKQAHGRTESKCRSSMRRGSECRRTCSNRRTRDRLRTRRAAHRGASALTGRPGHG